ncbi:hypothetical protein LIER_34469 [Lithospermum erythrorhizon]|uniref:Uncharacterized protein n=1 Tax=Lithospermum erythrorhizon TaxID=34254 RepID=A0AAV3S470_LITER
MSGNRVLLFRPAKVASASVSGKRSAPIEACPRPLFAKRRKSIAHKHPRSEILDLTVDPPSSNIPEKQAPEDTTSLDHSTSDSVAVAEEESGSTNYLELPFTLPNGFHVTEDSTLWKKSNSFHASRPILLEWIGKDFESFRDPLEIHGALTRHLTKVSSSSSAFSLLPCIYLFCVFIHVGQECKLCYGSQGDHLDDAREEGCENERALQLLIKELKKENENLKVAFGAIYNEKKEVTVQAMAEIRKHDALQARFTRLEGKHFDISNKLARLQLIHSQEAKSSKKLPSLFLGEFKRQSKLINNLLLID